MSAPLDSSTLLATLQTLLPPGGSSPFPNPTDAVAALTHTIHTALGFRLIRPASLPRPADANVTTASDDQPSSSGSREDAEMDDTLSETTTAVDAETDTDGESGPGAAVAPPAGRLNEGWNARGEDAYVFEYRHEQSAMEFRIRLGRMGARVQVDAMAADGAPHHLSVLLEDVVRPAAFPVPGSATRGGEAANDAVSTFGFVSLDAIKTFVDKYTREIISKILPGLQIPGYNEPPSQSGSDPRTRPPPSAPQRHSPPPARPNPLSDPLHPSRDHPHPASIGHRDLDPLIDYRPPGAAPARGGGMYMDFTHPLFDGRRDGGAGNPDFEGPGGMINPPGARWDPVGPGMGGGPRFPSAGGNPMGGMGRGDWGDEMPPPGEFGPDMGGVGGIGGPLGGRGRGGGGMGGGGMGGMGGLGGFGRGGGGGGSGGFGGGGGMGGGGFGGGMYM